MSHGLISSHKQRSGKKPKYDIWDIEQAADKLKGAEEIRGNKELHDLAMKQLETEHQAISAAQQREKLVTETASELKKIRENSD